MEDKMQDWMLIVAPLALGSVGYLLRRWLERRRASEALKQRLQTLSLYQGLQRTGLSLDDLDRIQRRAVE